MKRLTIAGSMAAILLTSVGLAALASPRPPLVASVVCMVTLACLLSGLLGSVFRRGRVRAAWVGFTLFGWFFFAVFVLGLSFGDEIRLHVTIPITGLGLRLHPPDLPSDLDPLRAGAPPTPVIPTLPPTSGPSVTPSGTAPLDPYAPIVVGPTSPPILPPSSPTPSMPTLAFQQFGYISSMLASLAFGLLGAVLGYLIAPREASPE